MGRNHSFLQLLRGSILFCAGATLGLAQGGGEKMAQQERPSVAKEFFVSPIGNDGAAGTRDEPLATIIGARNAIRAWRKKDVAHHKKEWIVVWVDEGTYSLQEPIRFEKQDSGREDLGILYRSIEGARAVLSGGIQLHSFEKVTDSETLARLPEAARGQVYQCDLSACGIHDLGEISPVGFGTTPKPMPRLHFNGEPMRLARWPNEGFVKTGKVLEAGETSKSGAVFGYKSDRPRRWVQARDIWMYGYWFHLWADGSVKVDHIDLEKKRIHAAQGASYGTREDHPYFYFNLLEEIDAPGEWYLDRKTGLLFLFPPSSIEDATIELSGLDEPLIQMRDVSHVRFRGLALELGRSHGATIDGGKECRFEACEIRRMRGDGLIITGGKRHAIVGCDIYTMGRGGIRMSGGDRKTLEPGRHSVRNCHIYDLSQVDRTYTPAVHLDGCGNEIASNLFHHIPCHAMRVEGNDHLVELNEVHSVVWESDDQGGLDMWYNPTYRGNVIRHNYWHHIASGRSCGQAGVRLDDAICGTRIFGNVFYRCSSGHFGAVQIHGGKDNWIENNLFIRCNYGISFSRWGQQRWEQTLSRPDCAAKMKKEVNIDAAPYSTRYPELSRLWEDADVNHVWRNVVYDCGEFLTRDGGIQDVKENLVTDEDPGFVNAEKEDFRLREDSPVFDQIDFKQIPFGKIGLYRDELRASWPVEREILKPLR